MSAIPKNGEGRSAGGLRDISENQASTPRPHRAIDSATAAGLLESDADWADMRFPDGVHVRRRIVDVALHDPLFPDNEYLIVRARSPRPSWPAEVAAAVVAVACAAGLAECSEAA